VFRKYKKPTQLIDLHGFVVVWGGMLTSLALPGCLHPDTGFAGRLGRTLD